MKNLVFSLLLLALLSFYGPARAADNDSSSTRGQSKDSWTGSKMDVDKEVDEGAGDDKSDEATEPSRFKKDRDDSHGDAATGGDDWLKSRFGEDKSDDDKNTDDSDKE